jgi:hypothetical protein
MAIREFIDSRNVRWSVWKTVPQAGGVLDLELRTGWLTFDSKHARRRLAPIPPGWEVAPANRLELWCHAAEEVRTGTPERSSARTPEG